MYNKNKLYVLIGSSGSGKTTLGRATFGANAECISHTTRPIRPGEIQHKDYHFTDIQTFSQLIQQEQLIEHTTYADNMYGLSKQEIEQRLNTESPSFAVTEINGYLALKQAYPENIIGIFIDVPYSILLERLSRTHDQKRIQRLKKYTQEQEWRHHVDYIVQNIDQGKALAEINKIKHSAQMCR